MKHAEVKVVREVVNCTGADPSTSHPVTISFKVAELPLTTPIEVNIKYFQLLFKFYCINFMRPNRSKMFKLDIPSFMYTDDDSIWSNSNDSEWTCDAKWFGQHTSQ